MRFRRSHFCYNSTSFFAINLYNWSVFFLLRCYNRINHLLQSPLVFATIAYLFCYEVSGEVSGEISGESSLWFDRIIFATMKQKSEVFFCFIEAFEGFWVKIIFYYNYINILLRSTCFCSIAATCGIESQNKTRVNTWTRRLKSSQLQHSPTKLGSISS
jgi:hypothetical protein